MKYVEIHVKSALVRSKLQNIEYALNPYRGCEHHCVYCYAPHVLHIPTREWNTTIYVKRNLPTVLDRELRKLKGHIEIGTVTDAYQPAEKKYEITRMSLEVLKRHSAKISLLTKSTLVLRDIDLLSSMDAEVGVTLTTLRDDLRRRIEPHASTPEERLQILSEFSKVTKTYAFIGPIFPNFLLSELEALMNELKRAEVSYIIFDRFRCKRGMKIPEFLKINARWDEVKIKINRIAKEFDIRYYFGW